MKIVINAFSARLGGGQTYLRNLMAHLPENLDLGIVVYAPASLPLPQDPRVRLGVTSWPTQNPLLRSVWERLALPRALARERADILFCPGGVVATRAPKGCRVVTMFRNMIPFDARVRRSVPFGVQRLRNWLLQRVMLRSMAEADLTIFISAYARATIESLIRVGRAVTIPHGISDAFRSAGNVLQRPLGAPAARYLLYVSRFDVYKHHRELIEAYAQLPSALRCEHPLLLIGEADMPGAQQMRALIDRLGLKGQVLVAGSVPYRELPAYYHHAQAIVFASSCENCPNILLEALGAGRPIACSNVQPMPEFGGDAVEYFSPFDPQDIERALLQVLTDQQRSDQLAVAATARSRTYDWTTTARETWKNILEVSLSEAPDR